MKIVFLNWYQRFLFLFSKFIQGESASVITVVKRRWEVIQMEKPPSTTQLTHPQIYAVSMNASCRKCRSSSDRKKATKILMLDFSFSLDVSILDPGDLDSSIALILGMQRKGRNNYKRKIAPITMITISGVIGCT